MGKTNQLSLAQLRDLFRLLGEVRELGFTSSVWRRHMLQGLRKLVDADLAHAGEAPLPCSPVHPQFLGIEIDAVTERDRLEVYNWLIHVRDYTSDPCVEAMSKIIHRSFTCTRQQLAPNHLWYRRPDLDAWRTLGADYFIYSHQLLLNHRCIHLISLNRSWGRRAFSERERKLVAIFHEELGQLWRNQSSDTVTHLPPRVAQTLDLLLEGDHEKRIAIRLGISRHTVHDYIKVIHERFGVSSQAELIGRLYHEHIHKGPRLCCDFRM